MRFEEQAVPQTTVADLDERLWQRFLGIQTGDAISTLRKMRLLAQDEQGRDHATIAGVLLCSQRPQNWLPGAFIQAVHYKGTHQDSNYQIDAQEITGSLDVQIRDAIAFVRKNMMVAAQKDPARVERPEYSIRAVFEAIVNAVAHRDYSIHSSKIRLFIFDDRLEIYSPGPLPNTVTIENIALRQSTRNELITILLAKCPVDDPNGEIGRRFLMENRGDGVPIILEESYKLSRRYPVYRLIDDAELLLAIYAAKTY